MDRARKRLLRSLFEAALAGADPEAAVARALARPDVRRALSGRRRVGVFAVGKAAAAMARAAKEALPSATALVIVPRGSRIRGLARASVLRAAHPEPDAASVRAAKRALRFFASYSSQDTLVCLISGGASSLMALPRPGLSLSEKRRRLGALVRSGAPIEAVNRLRTSLSAVKGGRLGKATAARLVTLVLSDVPGDRAALVGSGPTIRIRGRRGDVAPGSGARRDVAPGSGARRDVAPGSGAQRDIVRVVGSNRASLAAAARQARLDGLEVVLSPGSLSGEASLAGRRLARRARGLAPGTVWIGGGETTVTLSSARGRGGRSLELALSAALALEGVAEVAWLAAGSDGRDGSSTAAGAFADGTTVSRARRLGLEPGNALRRHATHALFSRLEDLLVTGPTGTNVGDWVFLLRTSR